MRRSPDLSRISVLIALLAAATPAGARDRGSDGHFDQRRSSHFVLLQDVDIDQYSGRQGSRRFELDVLDILEDAYREVGSTLGIRPRSATRVLVYDPGDFQARFGERFRFRAAGFFDGVIHVRGDTRIDAQLVRTLHHEYTHAALDAAGRGFRFPAWLNEGLAEWFEARPLGKRRLSQGEAAVLAQAHQQGSLLPLASLGGPSFATLGGEEAGLAYLQAYAVVDHIARRHGERDLRRLCEQLVRTRSIERALDRALGIDLEELDRDWRADLP